MGIWGVQRAKIEPDGASGENALCDQSRPESESKTFRPGEFLRFTQTVITLRLMNPRVFRAP